MEPIIFILGEPFGHARTFLKFPMQMINLIEAKTIHVK